MPGEESVKPETPVDLETAMKRGAAATQARIAADPTASIRTRPMEMGKITTDDLGSLAEGWENMTEKDKANYPPELVGKLDEIQKKKLAKVVSVADTTLNTAIGIDAEPETSKAVEPIMETVPEEKSASTKTPNIEQYPEWKSMLKNETEQGKLETQQSWIDLIDMMKGEKGETPYFVQLGEKGEEVSAEQRKIILIESSELEKYLVITKNGLGTIDATQETKDLINRHLLGKEDAAVSGKIESLEITPLPATEDPADTFTFIVNKSKDMAREIEEERKKMGEEMKVLKASSTLAESLRESLAPKNAPQT